MSARPPVGKPVANCLALVARAVDTDAIDLICRLLPDEGHVDLARVR